MVVVIRMKKTGRRNRPCYRISVAERRAPRDGRTLETLGLYDPVSPNPEAQVTLNVDSARDWLSRGAQMSDTVRSIFKKQGVFEGMETKKPRKRKGRYASTKKREARNAAKSAREEKKTARRDERNTARREAAKAAKAAEAAEGGEGGEE